MTTFQATVLKELEIVAIKIEAAERRMDQVAASLEASKSDMDVNKWGKLYDGAIANLSSLRQKEITLQTLLYDSKPKETKFSPLEVIMTAFTSALANQFPAAEESNSKSPRTTEPLSAEPVIQSHPSEPLFRHSEEEEMLDFSNVRVHNLALMPDNVREDVEGRFPFWSDEIWDDSYVSRDDVHSIRAKQESADISDRHDINVVFQGRFPSQMPETGKSGKKNPNRSVNEDRLKRKVNLNVGPLLNADLPLSFVDDEWYVVPKQSDKGIGDLVFTDTAGVFYVVETKWLNHWGESDAMVKSRNEQRLEKVKEQAARYGNHWAKMNPGRTVHYFAVVNKRFSKQPEVVLRGTVETPCSVPDSAAKNQDVCNRRFQTEEISTHQEDQPEDSFTTCHNQSTFAARPISVRDRFCSFEDLPWYEHIHVDLNDHDHYVSPPSRHWCFIAEITKTMSIGRPRLLVRTNQSSDTFIHFHISREDISRFDWTQAKSGSTIAILYARKKQMKDGTIAIRQETMDTVIIFRGSLLFVKDTIEKLQSSRCFVCDKKDDLKMCGKCSIALYCCKEHQSRDWQVHKRLCPQISILKNFANFNSEDFNGYHVWDDFN